MIVTALLLAVCLAQLFYFVRNDAAEYAAFKLLSETYDRQRCFRRWITKSFLLFAATAVLGLALLHRLSAFRAPPPEFSIIAARLHDQAPNVHLSSGFLLGFLPGALIGGVALGLLFAKRSASKVGGLVLGDVEPLMPRNAAETLHTALLSLNAGLSEELYFRLMLPLLLVSVTGSALASLLIAALMFGTVHAYQGIVGVLATTILGVVITCIYLWTGTIWIPVALHAGLDLFGLVLRPTLGRFIQSGSTHTAPPNGTVS